MSARTLFNKIRSTFDDTFNQTHKLMGSVSSKIKPQLELGNNLSEEKSIHMNLKSMQHDAILNSLSEKVNSIAETNIKKKFDDAMKTYTELNMENKKNMELAGKYVDEHEQFNDLIERARDMITYLNIELSVLSDTPFDGDDTAKKIQTVNDLLGRKNEETRFFRRNLLVTVVSHTKNDGKN